MPGSSNDHLRGIQSSGQAGGHEVGRNSGSQEWSVERRGRGGTRSPADAPNRRLPAERGDGAPRPGAPPCTRRRGEPTGTSSARAALPTHGGIVGDGAQYHHVRPPDWLYLPAQGIFGGASHAISRSDLSACVITTSAQDDGADGDEHSAAAPGQRGRRGDAGDDAIRGRRASPGASDANTAGAGAASRIRGQPQVPGTPSTSGIAAAQRRLRDSQAHIAISLNDHAERVAAKRERQGGREEGATAAQRLEALRRRIEARAGAARLDDSQADALGPERVGHQSTATAGQAPETGGDGQEAPAVGTKEVLKMHFDRNDSACSSADGNACGASARSGAAAEASLGCSAEGAPRCLRDALPGCTSPTPAARAAAARQAAWHSGDAT